MANMALTSPNVLYILLGVLSFCLVSFFYRIITSPLRKIPGPWYASLTHLVLKKHVILGRRVFYIDELHQKYGSIVRIGPNEIDICDPQMFKEVHRIGSGFLKDPWYQTFRHGPGGIHDVFSMIDPKEHAERRRLFAPLWTNSALHEHWGAMVQKKAKLAVSRIKRDALQQEADIFKWWTFMTTDVITHLAFGESTDMLERESRNQYIEDVELAAKLGGVLAEFRYLDPLLKALPFPAIKNIVNADTRIHEYGRVAATNAKSRDLSKHNVFSRLLAQWYTDADQKEGPPLTEFEVSFEAGGFIVAGSGTTAVTLTYLVWAVLSHPDIQKRLEAEVAGLDLDYSDAQLEKLPYLNGVIDEALRLYGAAPGSLPRSAPKGGFTLHGGYFIPEMTTVSSQAFSLHRDESIYPNAQSFMPERFLDSQGQYASTKALFVPFGAGSRTCLGIHLAKMELRHGAAEFFRECAGARMANSMEADDMKILNFFLISPKELQLPD
ncbi:cytochrome P450 [Cadophora sp. MPI-SDFR-AT-0126]|nr:cytochrome P450 [Leotiomycetes sp. MPI-SDFR-AT-0126]